MINCSEEEIMEIFQGIKIHSKEADSKLTSSEEEITINLQLIEIYSKEVFFSLVPCRLFHHQKSRTLVLCRIECSEDFFV